ncbi:MAG: RNA polymerase sigma factor [Steroidobacter sp.]|nr:RNA polymerase sigma factor [Steroidobacter sp.]
MRRLFEEHNRSLVSFLTARLNSVSEARDVAQEAYARLMQLERPGAVSFLRAYLFRIAANLAVDRIRQRKVRTEGTPQEFFEGLLSRPSPERVLLGEQQVKIIAAALEELPEKCRQAFALHCFGDRDVRDIARQMGLTERMVQKYLARGLEHCRARLEQSGVEGASQGARQ